MKNVDTDLKGASIGVALVHSPRFQERRDFEEIAQRIRAGYPEIDAFVVNNFEPTEEDYARVAAQPTLVFSPVKLAKFQPEGAKIYQGRPISKIDQSKILRLNGIPTPKAERLALQAYDPKEWTDWVVIKPVSFKQQSKGDLFRIRVADLNRDIAFREEYLKPLVTQPHLIQEWIDTGPRLAYMRALTLFGEVLYSARYELTEEFRSEDDGQWTTKFVRVTSRGGRPKEKEYTLPGEVENLCRKTYQAFSERPLLGIDVIYDVQKSRYMVLEINSGGNTWHFSSDHIKQRLSSSKKFRSSRKQKIKQFDAFSKAAKVIANKSIEILL